MMQKRLAIFALFSGMLALGSCSDEKQIRFLDDQSFPEILKMTECEPIPGFLMTESLAVCDSILVVQNTRDSAIFSMVNLHSRAVVRSWGNRGRAANEYLMPRLVAIGGERFAVVDKPNAKVEWHHTNHQYKTDQIPWKLMPMSITYGGGNRFVFDVKRPEDLKLYHTTLNADPVEIADFAPYAAIYPSPSCYNGFVAVDTSSQVVVYAFQYLDGFDLLANDGSLRAKVRRKKSSEPVCVDGRVDVAASTTYCFGLKSTAEGFWLYRVAINGAALQNNLRQTTYIEQFDWNGNPVRRYEIPFFVADFAPIGNHHFVLQDISSENTILHIACFE